MQLYYADRFSRLEVLVDHSVNLAAAFHRQLLVELDEIRRARTALGV